MTARKLPMFVNQEKFDGIFLDLEMPNINGFDLARNGSASRPGINLLRLLSSRAVMTDEPCKRYLQSVLRSFSKSR